MRSKIEAIFRFHFRFFCEQFFFTSALYTFAALPVQHTLQVARKINTIRKFGSPEILVFLPVASELFFNPGRQRPFLVKMSLFSPKITYFRTTGLSERRDSFGYFRRGGPRCRGPPGIFGPFRQKSPDSLHVGVRNFGTSGISVFITFIRIFS